MLSLVEQAVLMYRTLVTVPCWLFYFQSLGMGDVLTSCMNGTALRCTALLALLRCSQLGIHDTACTAPCRSVPMVQGAHPVLGGDGGLRLCEGHRAAAVCVRAPCGGVRPAAHGGRQDMPHLPGTQQL